MPLVRRGKSQQNHAPDAQERPEASRPKRYLVLGSDGHGHGVKSYRWDKLPSELNVADYDVVILNFSALEDEALAEGLPLDRLPSREAMTRQLFSPSSEIIAIGDPRTPIGPEPPAGKAWFASRTRADYWLPCWLEVEDDNGTSFEVLAEEWRSYFDTLTRWRWFATGEYGASDQESSRYLQPVTREANAVGVRLAPIAETRFQKPIGLAIHVAAVRLFRYNPAGGPGVSGGLYEGQDTVLEGSPVFWLPSPDKVTTSEAIDLILRDRYGVAAEARRPDWAGDYYLPVEEVLHAEIKKIEQERRAVEARLTDARKQAAEGARPRLLLYEKGKEVLEPIVRQTLRELGGPIEEPQAEGVEDGTLSRPEGQAVVEIKGRSGPIKLDDVRQVVQWAADAKGREGVTFKPIIVGNPHCDTAPDLREAPMAPNARTYAENSDVAFVSTVQVYEALRQKQGGQFDEASFWRTVFDARGPSDLPVPPHATSR